MRFLLGFLAAAFALTAAQQAGDPPPVRLEIRGVVLEPGTNQPVPDAEISLSTLDPGPVRINGGWKPDSSRKATTDYSGSFALPIDKPGQYRVEARKPGYFAVESSGSPAFAEVNLTADKSNAVAKLFLARPGRLTGIVLDEDTGKPLSELRLRAVRPSRPFGFLPAGEPAKTNAGGEFTLADLPPGEYAVEIGPQTETAKRVLTNFTEKDAKALERDYEPTLWPGGHGADSALPVSLSSGATVYVGRLRVRKVPYYRVHVQVTAPNCEPGATVSILESIRNGSAARIHGLSSAPCGKDVLVTGFAPGSYRLIFSTEGRTPAARATASVPFEIIDRNLVVAAPLVPGVAIEGSVVGTAGARLPDLTTIRVGLTSVDRVGFGEPAQASPDAAGKFRLENVRLLDQMIFISGMNPAAYVKEIRYNGVALESDTIPLNSGVPAHALTIVVDDQPGTITGAVMAGDKPVSKPFVIARKWPMKAEPTLSGWARATGDDGGRFQIAGLAPGEYRVIALRALSMEMGNAFIEGALAAGTKVEIGPRGFANVTLEVTEFR